MAFWLAKTEPAECGIEDFERAPATPIAWVGVRNYQARNYLKAMAEGDAVLVYHSSCKLIGVAGVVRVTRTAYPDPTQFDSSSPYHDPKSPADAPRWVAVDMVFERRLPELLTLDDLRALPALAQMPLLQRGNRLSVMPVTAAEWAHVLQHAGGTGR
jgi:predicted RNA-binding protein with PUA-like domain